MILWIIFAIYTVFIVAFFHRILKSLKWAEKPIPTVTELHKPFERQDRNNWSLLEIYFGAIFLVPIRLFFILLSLVLCLSCQLLGAYGMKLTDEWNPKRHRITKFLVTFLARCYMFASGFYYIKKHTVKYSDFLPGAQSLDQPPAIIVSNHISWYDTIFYVSQFMPSFLSKADVQKYPIFGPITTALKSLYLDRSSRDEKDQILNKIQERCNLISSGKLYPPLIIFPEGTSTNGKSLISFKRGAFEPLMPIKICCLKYYDRRFNLALDNIGIMGFVSQYLLFLQASAAISLTQLYNKLEFYEFEGVFDPKQLNLEKYPEEQRVKSHLKIKFYKWEVFASIIKSIMSKCLQIPTNEAGFRHSKEFTMMAKEIMKAKRN